MDSHVAQLVEMGFDARAATGALHDHPRFEDALNFLMAHPDWMPGVLHATTSTPSDAVVAYEVSVPRVVAGTYFEISVQSRGQQWTVQKKITQFEELYKELCGLFSRELQGVAAFPAPGMFQSREDPALLESRRQSADEFLTICAHSDTVCETEQLLRFLGLMEHILEADGVSGRHEGQSSYASVSRGTAGGGVEMQDMGDPWSTGSHRAQARGSAGVSVSRPASPPRPPAGSSDPGIDAEDMVKVAVFGAGAVGGLIGSFLARQIQQGIGKMQLSLFARGEHLQTLKLNGLWVNLPGGEQFVVQEGPFVSFLDGSMTAEVGAQDYVFVATRAPDLNVATAALSALLGSDTTVITLQAGIPFWFCFGWRGPLHNEQVEPVDPTGSLWDDIGPDRVVGAVFDVSCALTAPGEITVATFGDISLGEPESSGPTTRLEILSEMLTTAGIVALAADDIRSAIWERTIRDVAHGALGALTLQSLGEMANDPSSIQLAHRVTDELISVAEAAGLEVAIDPAQVLADAARDRSASKSPMHQDVAKGRRPELESLLLGPKEIAEQIGVETPTLDVLSLLLEARCARMARPQEESISSSAPSVGGSAASMVTRPASPEREGRADASRYKSRAVSPERGGGSSGAYGATRPASPDRRAPPSRRPAVAAPPAFGTRPASPERGGGGGFETRPASPGGRQVDAFKSRAASPDRSAAGGYGTRPASRHGSSDEEGGDAPPVVGGGYSDI